MTDGCIGSETFQKHFHTFWVANDICIDARCIFEGAFVVVTERATNVIIE